MNIVPDQKSRRTLVFDLLLVCVLVIGAYFRLVGLNWGEYQYLHPDERFLIWVGSDIQPVGTDPEKLGPPPSTALNPARGNHPDAFPDCQAWGGYFDASCSPLNPNNRGHGFYVYGTLPMFLTRYIVEWIYGHSGFQEMTDVGRFLSAMADLLTVFLVYVIATRLYDRRVGVLSAAFSAVAVLQIQLSHYFAMETFLNLFTYLAIYFAVRVGDTKWQVGEEGVLAAGEMTGITESAKRFVKHPLFIFSIAFGFALGCAVASKLNAGAVAVALPVVFGLKLLAVPAEERMRRLGEAFAYLCLAAVVSLLAFRLFQPYAFSGPGFFGLKPNPMWVSNILEQRIQASGDVDFPPALQWARRPVWFSGKNLVLWGLGLPLGLLAWAGFLWAGWKLLADKSENHKELRRHGLLWGWTLVYFIWQSLEFNATMRYQFPIYPALAIFAGWALVQLWIEGGKYSASAVSNISKLKLQSINIKRVLAVMVGGVVLLASIGWAWAFSRIYVRPITRIEASRWIYQNVPGPINLRIRSSENTINQPLPYPEAFAITKYQPYVTRFSPAADGQLTEIFLAHVLDLDDDQSSKTLVATIKSPDSEVSTRLTSDFSNSEELRGQGYLLSLERPLTLQKDVQYQLSLALETNSGTLTLLGSAPANESTWDDGLPLRLEGYDGYGGIYQTGLNFEMYWDDNADKFQRFVTTLDQADYIFISSNRQWGTIPRVPERYPLSSAYYRNLLGCQPDKDVVWCYSVAQEGTFQGNLGFELAKVFDSSPRIGPWVFNDQFAEEAFTVYDHPKVLIFRKTSDYDPVKVRAVLGEVDYSQAVHITPRRASARPVNLTLPIERWAEQRAGGTWSELYNTRALHNRFPALGVGLWYLVLTVLGWVVYPLARLALPGLVDRGYPMARTIGLLLLSYLVWLAGSARIPFTRITISLVFALILLASAMVVYRQRGELRQEWRERRGYFLRVEMIFLAFFVFDLLIRIGNPDLWHPWKGGEKPMDFSYFNAVLKSTSFPPYDPWYAGGYLNYYYYGFVFVGVLVKWLGIVPAVAYNLIIPTLFSMIAMGAFSLGWNLFNSRYLFDNRQPFMQGSEPSFFNRISPFIPALAAAFGMAVLGNLGTVRMLFQGYQRIVAPDGVIEGVGLLTRWGWAVRGFVRVLSGANLPYSIGDWYWIPSRAIPAPNDVEPITEFPFFTVLYADPHAHLFALPIALLVLGIALSLVLGRARWKSRLEVMCGFVLAGLAIGALRPTNTWDFYPYLALGSVAMIYALGLYFRPVAERPLPLIGRLPPSSQRLVVTISGFLLLLALSMFLYQPYATWYALGYSKLAIWKGSHTTLSAYLTHWGLFLFVIVSWMVWETRDWLASTPVSALRKLKPYRELVLSSPFVLLGVVLLLAFYFEVAIAWLVLPLAVWAGVLLLRPNQSDAKRFVLFLVGSGLLLTLMVEVIVLVGDIGRMNTVFKFYLQVWTMFAVCAAAALGWILTDISGWLPGWRVSWQVVLTILGFGAAMFSLMGSMAKVEDRMSLEAPYTLDGMAFMAHTQYEETWGTMDLSQDYRAIRWMQENVSASPVIVEANQLNLYRWGSRFSIYTGLPGVVGWEWHQKQQRAAIPTNWVSERIAEIETFYTTTDLLQAQSFLSKYDVRYIILGQQERGLYAGEQGEQLEGLAKFSAADGLLWRSVYRDGDTIIYEVMDKGN